MNFLRKLFDTSKKDVEALMPIVDRINGLEEEYAALPDEELKAKTPEFKARLEKGESLDSILPEAYAAVREVSKRTLGMRHFDVQLVGATVLNHGRISAMRP